MRTRRGNKVEARERGTATILGHPDLSGPCPIPNISQSGMCIAVDAPIVSEKVVKVEWNDHFLVGRVRRISPAGQAYEIGLELLYCSKWNEAMKSVLAPR